MKHTGRAITYIFIIIQSLIVSLLLFAAGRTDHYIKRDQLGSNGLYFAVGLGLVLVFVLISYIAGKKGCMGALQDLFSRYEGQIVFVTIVLFFGLSLTLCVSGFFYSDWDPAAIVQGVYSLLDGHPETAGVDYYSNHPNNLLLVWLYHKVLLISSMVGIRSIIAIVVFQCIILAFSEYLFYRILADILNNRVQAYVGLFIFELWWGLSPWFIITYSDEAGFIFPLILIRLYQKITRCKYNCRNGNAKADRGCKESTKKVPEVLVYPGYWVLMGVIAGIGYFIKPQIVIVFIVCVITEILRISSGRCAASGVQPADMREGREGDLDDMDEKDQRHEKDIKDITCTGVRLLAVFASLGGIILAFVIVKALIIPSMGIDLDSSRSFGMAHYFMMGLNDATDGVYSDEDTLFTDSYDTPREKREADLGVAGKRIREYGIAGLIKHSCRKILVNYNDGLFAWGIDGNFFAGRLSEGWGDVDETMFTPFVDRFIRPDGSDHGKYAAYLQMIWIMVQFMCLISGIRFLIWQYGRGIGLFDKGIGAVSGVDMNTDSDKEKEAVSSSMVVYAVMLSLTGIFLFELLFEAKARYLIIFAPIYLLMALCIVGSKNNNARY